MSLKKVLEKGKPWITTICAMALFAVFTLPALAQTRSDFPYPLKTITNDDDKQVKALEGFDELEYGGDSSKCPLENITEDNRLAEELGQSDSRCSGIWEWSLKVEDTTIMSGMYAAQPGESARLKWAAINGRVNFVGTLHTLPRMWNAHMQAANYAGAWQPKNVGLPNVVGLSPTDPWVQELWAGLEAQYEGSTGTPNGSTPDSSDNGGGQTCKVQSNSHSKVNIRSGAGTNYSVVKTVAVGTVLNFVGESNNWKKITEGQYILGSLCAVQAGSEPADG